MDLFAHQHQQPPQRIHHQQSGSVDIDILSPTSSTNNADSLFASQIAGYSDFNAPPPGSPALNDLSFTPSYAAQAGSYHGSPYGSDVSFTGADDFNLDLNPNQASDLVNFGPADLSISDDYDPAAYDAPADTPSFFSNDFMASLTESAQSHFSPQPHYGKFASSPAMGVNIGISHTGTSSPSMSQNSSTSSTGHRHPHVSVTPAPELSPRMGMRGMGLDAGAYAPTFDHGSPASSAGGDHISGLQARSRASSVSSAHNAQQQTHSGGQDFSTATGLAQSWPYVNAGQLPQSPPPTNATKPQSPPQLSIPPPEITPPSPTHSTHSNRSEHHNAGNSNGGGLLGSNLGGGLNVGGPGINIEPATPVSGGGAQTVQFHQTLESLGQGHPTSNSNANIGQSQQSQFTSQHQRNVPSPHPRLPPAPPSPYVFAPGPSLSPSPGPPGSGGTSVDGDTGAVDGGLGGAGYARQHMRSSSQGMGHSSPFLSPSASPSLGGGLSLEQQQQDNEFLMAMNQNQRTRSKSDTSLTPPNWQVQGQQQQQQQQQAFGGTVNMSDVMGYGGTQQHQPQQMVQSHSQHGSPIPSHPQLMHHVTYGPPAQSSASANSSIDFLSPNMTFVGLGPSSVDLRRARSESGMGHRRGARSEDITARRYDSNSLFPPQSAGSGQYLMPGSGDMLGLGLDGGAGMGGSVGGAGAHRRSLSGGSYGRSLSRERGTHLSHGTSPYPSPHASPRALPNDLPPNDPLGLNAFSQSYNMGMSVPSNADPSMGGVPVHVMSVGADGRPTVQSQGPIIVPRQNVTTNATADASQRRRRTEATFVCPVPGCGSTFTRHFNLKGHLRSHNEERPFKCKWPGCDKGFARQHDCKRHEQLHLNIRPYICQGCQRTFARMDALNRHLRSDAGAECQARQPLLTNDQPNNPDANANEHMNGNGAEQQDVKPSWNANGVMV